MSFYKLPGSVHDAFDDTSDETEKVLWIKEIIVQLGQINNHLMKLDLIRTCLRVILKQPHFLSFKISLMFAFKLWPGIFIQSNFRSTFNKHALVGFETYDYESTLFDHYKRIFHFKRNFYANPNHHWLLSLSLDICWSW